MPARLRSVQIRNGFAWTLAGLFALMCVPREIHAQLPQTRLYALFPPGVKSGTTADVAITSGADLDEVNHLHFNHPGIKAEQKTAEVRGKQRPVANAFTVTVAADVPPGLYEVRAAGLFGVSNPRTFAVSQREEIQETEPNNSDEQAQEIQLGQVVNGRANGATDVDWFKFSGKAGQRILATCTAARIDSRMKAAVEVYTAAGLRLDYGREDYRGDPLIDVTLPADGDYILKVHDFTYRGGNDYFYRLLAHTGPHIDYVLPPAGLPGTNGQYTLYGRNLPGGEPSGILVDDRELQKQTVSIALPKESAVLDVKSHLAPHQAGIDAISHVVSGPGGPSNPALVHIADAPVALEQEPNNEAKQANKLTVPGELAGQFQDVGDVDIVDFDAKSGEVYYIETVAERLGTLADPYFTLDQVTRNEQGEETLKRLTTQDDNATNLAANIFTTMSQDPVYRFQVPADATYRIALRDRYSASRGDPRLVYRLVVRKENPDFRLVVLPFTAGANNASLPSAIVLRQGDNQSARVLAFRRDGFDGTIDITCEGLPKGVECKGAAIGPGQTGAELIFTSTEDVAEWFGHVTVKGAARIVDPEKARAVQAAIAAVKPANDAIPKLQEAAQKAAEAAEKAKTELAAAEAKLKEKPDDDGLKNAVEKAKQTVASADEAAKKASDALAAGEKQVADAEAAVKAAEAAREASAKDVTRPARAATVVWNGDQNNPAISRLSEAVAMSITSEAAPFQVTTDVFRVEANQSRQILVPVKLAKRDGFDNNVALTVTGLPNNANIDVENKPIPKGSDSELLRLFVKENAPSGTYTVYLNSAGQISYKHNAALAERLKSEQAEFTKLVDAATEAAKQAAQTRDAAAKQAADAANAMKQAESAKKAAEEAHKAAQDAVTKAQQEQAAAAKAAADAAAAAKTAAEQADAAKKAADAASDNKELAEAAAKAAKQSADAATAAEQAAKAKTEADQKVAAAEAEAKKTGDAQTATDKSFTEAQAAAKAADAEKAKTDQAAKDADAKLKSLQAEKTAFDKEVQTAANAAKPKNLNITPPSTPILITVKPAPITLSAAVPGGGNIKRGDKIEVKVTVKRINNFGGPVTLELPLPPNVQGLTASPVTIPADQTEGVLTIAASGDATEGQLKNMVIRGKAEFDGDAAVDVAVNLKVSK